MLAAVYEGVEEYSCKYFAVRTEKRKLSVKQQGPLVSQIWYVLARTRFMELFMLSSGGEKVYKVWP